MKRNQMENKEAKTLLNKHASTHNNGVKKQFPLMSFKLESNHHFVSNSVNSKLLITISNSVWFYECFNE